LRKIKKEYAATSGETPHASGKNAANDAKTGTAMAVAPKAARGIYPIRSFPVCIQTGLLTGERGKIC
jgi:hypothetical protein